MKSKILLLCPYPHGQAPSQRFRFEQYLDFLEQKRLAINQQGFLDEQTWNILYKPGNQVGKIKGIIKGFVKRFLLLFTVFQYDFVFIHREATPLGPPFIEWVIAKVFCKKIIYDFDDAIWLANTSQENKIAAALKYHGKVKAICKWSYLVTCGNSYLADFARQYNDNVKVVPTTIDTSYHSRTNKVESRKTEELEPTTKMQEPRLEDQDARVKNQESRTKNQEPRVKNQVPLSSQQSVICNLQSSISSLQSPYSLLTTHYSILHTPIIGWTGTHSTEKYLDELLPVLQELEKDYSFIFRVISNHNPALPLTSFEYQPWNKASEIDDLSQFDIGVMPLEDNEWAKGKCGFKGLQYMALGIATVMSPVGVNKEIIQQDENGFLASSSKEWKAILAQLLDNAVLRKQVGEKGVKTIEQVYSVKANESVYLSFFLETNHSR